MPMYHAVFIIHTQLWSCRGWKDITHTQIVMCVSVSSSVHISIFLCMWIFLSVYVFFCLGLCMWGYLDHCVCTCVCVIECFQKDIDSRVTVEEDGWVAETGQWGIERGWLICRYLCVCLCTSLHPCVCMCLRALGRGHLPTDRRFSLSGFGKKRWNDHMCVIDFLFKDASITALQLSTKQRQTLSCRKQRWLPNITHHHHQLFSSSCVVHKKAINKKKKKDRVSSHLIIFTYLKLRCFLSTSVEECKVEKHFVPSSFY